MRPLSAFLILTLSASTALAWIPETNLSPGMAGAAAPPCMAVDHTGKVHVIYSADPPGGNNNVNLYYRVLVGSTWSNPMDLPGPNHKEPLSSIAVGNDGQVHVVGTYRVDGSVNTPYSVYYWNYNGTTWTGPTLLSAGVGTDNNSCSSAKIAIDRNNDLHVVWAEDGKTGNESDIMYRKRAGGVWQATWNVTQNNAGTSYGSVSCDLAVDRNGNNVHIVWHDDFLNNGFQAYYTKNSNLGATNAWTPSGQWFQLSSGNYGKSPKILLDGSDNPHVWWTDRFGGSSNVQGYRRWTGTAWTPAENWGGTFIQEGAFEGNVLKFVHTAVDSTGTTELFYRIYNNGTFSNPELVSTGANTYKVDGATMAISNGNVLTVWEERKGEWPGVSAIYFSAQATPNAGPTGTLTGNVKDQANAPVPGATVSVSGMFSTLTDAAGNYQLTLPPGVYTVSVSKGFFAGPSQNDVVITQDQTTTLNFTMTASPPDPITYVLIGVGNTSNTLYWNNPKTANFTGTTIRYRTDGFPVDATDGFLLVERPGTPSASDSFHHAGLTNGVTYYYSLFAHNSSMIHATAANISGTPFGPGDFDRDGDVDQADFGFLQACLLGPVNRQYDPDCADADMNGDGYVTQSDYQLFRNCQSAPNVAADPDCMN